MLQRAAALPCWLVVASVWSWRCASAGAASPCAHVAATRTADFVSTCGTEHAAHRDPSLVVYACVLLNRSSLRADDALEPLARTYTPDAFVGRVFPSAAKAVRNDTTDWDDYFPIALTSRTRTWWGAFGAPGAWLTA